MPDALLRSGRPLNGWGLRKIMEEQSEYEDALALVKTTPFVSTEFVIMSGVKKGAIVARSPDAVTHVQTLGQPNFDEPPEYIIVTNFDFWYHDFREYFDPTAHHIFRPRRIFAQKHLNATLKKGDPLTPELLNATINMKGVLADTIYQSVVNVEKDLWQFSIPDLPTKLP